MEVFTFFQNLVFEVDKCSTETFVYLAAEAKTVFRSFKSLRSFVSIIIFIFYKIFNLKKRLPAKERNTTHLLIFPNLQNIFWNRYNKTKTSQKKATDG